MDEKKRDTVSTWLVKAQRDLNVAQKLSSDEDPDLDAAIYHCQQAAEKAIKAYLVFQDQRFEKTHDLEVLAGLAQPYEIGFSNLIKPAVMLTPYATQFRYPGDFIEP